MIRARIVCLMDHTVIINKELKRNNRNMFVKMDILDYRT